MKIYLDSEFKCHTTNDNGIYREVTLSENAKSFFSNKCMTFIEGYRLKPDGETWVREDEDAFSGGEMISPWKPYDELDFAQREYERQLLKEYEANLAEYKANLAELDSALLDIQYQNLVGGL